MDAHTYAYHLQASAAARVHCVLGHHAAEERHKATHGAAVAHIAQPPSLDGNGGAVAFAAHGAHDALHALRFAREGRAKGIETAPRMLEDPRCAVELQEQQFIDG